MTREQAIQKGTEALVPLWRGPEEVTTLGQERRAARDLVAVLEALGLVKFEEVSKSPFSVLRDAILPETVTINLDGTRKLGPPGATKIISDLADAGYEIVRKDPFAGKSP